MSQIKKKSVKSSFVQQFIFEIKIGKINDKGKKETLKERKHCCFLSENESSSKIV